MSQVIRASTGQYRKNTCLGLIITHTHTIQAYHITIPLPGKNNLDQKFWSKKSHHGCIMWILYSRILLCLWCWVGGVHSKLLLILWSSPGNQSRMILIWNLMVHKVISGNNLCQFKRFHALLKFNIICDCLERSNCLIKKRKRLNGVTVPPSKMHPGGAVPLFKMHPRGTVPYIKMHPGYIFLSLILDCIPKI